MAKKTTKKKVAPKGLGDTVEKITEVTGIKKAVKWIFGEDCGCEDRKEWLNKKFPYSKQLTETEFGSILIIPFLATWLTSNEPSCTSSTYKPKYL